MALTRWIRRGLPPATAGHCREIGPLVQAFLDVELDPLDAIRVAGHLDACRRCGLDADTYRTLKRSLIGLRAPVDEAAVARLERFLDELVVAQP